MRRRTFVLLGVLSFLLAFSGGVASKIVKPSSMKMYATKWDHELGVRKTNLSYGAGKAQTFDLYLPKAHHKTYGLVVYLHAGGFTSGDKKDDTSVLSWLCQKGYVAAGINYTLVTKNNHASVFSQSLEIKKAMPKVVKAAQKAGYPIDKMAIAGGSAGHTLAMIYAYRDGAKAPVPVVFTFGAVGPSSFYAQDWGIFGAGIKTLKERKMSVALFSAMSGQLITAKEIANGSYLQKVKPISAAMWVKCNPIPTVVAYGAYDKLQPFAASKRLEKALADHHVDYQYFVLPHSGHGLQNDDAIAIKWMQAIEAYLHKYMPLSS